MQTNIISNNCCKIGGFAVGLFIAKEEKKIKADSVIYLKVKKIIIRNVINTICTRFIS